ncbi:hypothetical protein Pcac1_g23779 [Phytophthora cactorum]|uniref:Transglutaminase elicitor n=2 Tax=Phytophthora cactorum TaxID=29920 RepID=A0A8T1A923_9STRA|nr:hypothetical protein Pcac1_g23782 [Phytophthora cactorum]KAG2764650.1 hypothetical protein Pcac1_g23779 [Phytophthora cactorum]KAG2867004.1 hypothetical protein PC114_g27908 [Phytophthora cactorum]KAG2870894.1 hypothetical protein PC115_g24990 [Phytophthora cactorum]KAG2873654.1 hypothetical protein PC117_g27760 [Phytophthora cactorum]
MSTVFTVVRYSGGNFSYDKYGRNADPTRIPGFSTSPLPTYLLVDGFKVYEQDVMTPEEAAHSLKSYPWNKDAKSIVHVKSRLSWSNATFAGRESEVDEQTGTGADFEYLLEMDDVDQIIGGEWLNKSNDDYPDFLWFPEGKPAVDTVTSIS